LSIRRFSQIFIIINLLIAQPDSRFDPFDWVMYCQTGRINSISEGFNYTYFATKSAGILRLNNYQDKFEDPITIAQGLSDNHITAVHFDKTTGILWAASDSHIDYSYSANGNWLNVDIDDFSLSDNVTIKTIGSSDRYLWLNAGSVFIKLDKVSGIFFGIYPSPDDDTITWSSGTDYINEIPYKFLDLTLMDGWIITPTKFIDPYGYMIDYSTYFTSEMGDTYIGLEDGTIFKGSSHSEIFYPFEYGLNHVNVNRFTNDDLMWVVGDDLYTSRGITKFNFNTNEFLHIDFENELNIRSDSFYSILDMKKEVWFGGNSMITIYNTKQDYWRQIGEESGISSEKIRSMAEDESSIWVGTDLGLFELSKLKKYAIESEIENFFKIKKINDIEMIDRELWIATPRNLYAYDTKIGELYKYRNFGNHDQIGDRFKSFSNFSDISIADDEIFVSTGTGILKYNIKYDEWTIAVEPSSYCGSNIKRIAISENYCFASTDGGMWQIDMNDGISQLFDFKFLDSVNDLYVNDDVLFIGSDEGFIKYLWKKNL